MTRRDRTIVPRMGTGRSSIRTHAVGVSGIAVVLVIGIVTIVQSTGSDRTGTGNDALVESFYASADRVSRDLERPPFGTEETQRSSKTKTRHATRATALRAAPKSDAVVLATLKTGDKVVVTGQTRGGWTEVLHNSLPRWVRTKHLAKTAPVDASSTLLAAGASKSVPVPPAGGVSLEPCRLGSGIESGLQPDSVRVYRAVCARFPQITRFGGASGGGEHGTGQALDIMVSGALGHEIAAFLRANSAQLGVSVLIYEQHIWTVQRGSEGWRPMASRGSMTADHYDHVHVTTYGTAGSA